MNISANRRIYLDFFLFRDTLMFFFSSSVSESHVVHGFKKHFKSNCPFYLSVYGDYKGPEPGISLSGTWIDC